MSAAVVSPLSLSLPQLTASEEDVWRAVLSWGQANASVQNNVKQWSEGDRAKVKQVLNVSRCTVRVHAEWVVTYICTCIGVEHYWSLCTCTCTMYFSYCMCSHVVHTFISTIIILPLSLSSLSVLRCLREY